MKDKKHKFKTVLYPISLLIDAQHSMLYSGVLLRFRAQDHSMIVNFDDESQYCISTCNAHGEGIKIFPFWLRNSLMGIGQSTVKLVLVKQNSPCIYFTFQNQNSIVNIGHCLTGKAAVRQILNCERAHQYPGSRDAEVCRENFLISQGILR